MTMVVEALKLTYFYETLLDEHFQHLCQALLLKSFPRLQCLPVGMPDGGRDALTSTESRGTIIFQVKFARDPNAIKDPVSWVKKVIDGELGKIERLAEGGATEYILMTNVRGSSHLENGRNDKISSYLEERLPIPAACWWRDDLDRRLDNNFDLKLRYPSLLSGTDMLRLIWQHGETGRKGIENTALRAYLAAQYDQDKAVRFKQAELTASPLFKIFIDVPFSAARKNRARAGQVNLAAQLMALDRRIAAQRGADTRDAGDGAFSISRVIYGDADGSIVYVERENGIFPFAVGAADALLDAEFYRRVRLVVLEGAPGQGKSTLTQYVGQVHRARLLEGDRSTEIPAHHNTSPVAVPLRLELRDLAQWLRGKDPWTTDQKAHRKRLSLESAIAAHITHLAGGVPYRLRDLHDLLASTPVYLLLDGLDEVADLDDRRRVVEEVLSAATRIEGVARQLNILVTSRPTVVSGTPTFPADKFVFLKLSAINRDLALEYTDKWAEVRNLNDNDRGEVRRILAEKMDAPHMAELAKNTMQLSILLSLIYLRGSSLPDKRTELYDTYVDTFLNRESEKNAIVRKNRRLLVEIHRYLAFYLHANAEGRHTSGRIRVAELRKVISDYLVREGRPPALVDELVIGAVERVVALVSRVEGTYEFEVQPLREYFAARYLYDTAPYSPAGRNRVGTKPDRFDTVARNPYWLNVTRFFAGCFSKGELLDLAERLCNLIESPEFRFATYARSLAIAFLQDWVFAQSVTATSRVVSAVFDDFGIRIYGGAKYGRIDRIDVEEGFVLSDEAGGSHLVRLLWDRLKLEVGRTQRSDALCRLLMRHVTDSERGKLWLAEAYRRRGERLAGWFSIGRFLHIFPSVPVDNLEELLESVPSTLAPRLLGAVARGGGFREELGNDRLAASLDYSLRVPRTVSGTSSDDLAAFLAIVSPNRWIVRGWMSGVGVSPTMLAEAGTKKSNTLRSATEAIVALTNGERLWAGVRPWTETVSLLLDRFGKNWTGLELAIMSAGVVDAKFRGAGANKLFDENVSLTARVRFAKRKFRDYSWWRLQLENAQDDTDRAFWLALVYIWGDPSMLADLLPQVDYCMRNTVPDLRTAVAYACERSAGYSERVRKPIPLAAHDLLGGRLSPATVALVCRRLAEVEPRLLETTRKGIREPWVATVHFDLASRVWLDGNLDTDAFLEAAKVSHEAGARGGISFTKDSQLRRFKEAASQIFEMSSVLPNELILRAQVATRRPRKPRPVLMAAEEQDWFNRSGLDQ